MNCGFELFYNGPCFQKNQKAHDKTFNFTLRLQANRGSDRHVTNAEHSQTLALQTAICVLNQIILQSKKYCISTRSDIYILGLCKAWQSRMG